MAMLISRATGNFTAAATWGVADAATNSQLTNPSASTNTTTSYVYSSTFTGTNTRVADGIVLFLKRLNTTGTVTVALSDDNGVTATREVTVNASDLPADESWVFFKFGTTLTLDGGTDYRVGVVASSADNALIYRDGTAGNWARMVSTTLTGAPAAGDTMLIVGEWTGAGASSSYTVTMDNTATTDFGTGATVSGAGTPNQTTPRNFTGLQIGQNGTLNWGTSAATNYYLRLSGYLLVWSGGTYNMGTSGTPCPRDSTMTLLLDSSGNTATTAYCLGFFNGAICSIYGQSRTAGKNIVACKLSADAAANATSLTVDTDTGWLDNDQVVIASTSRTNTECEIGALNGNAASSVLTVDGFAGTGGGLAFAHSGTSPTQAEIINLTRNVVIRGNSTSQNGYFRSYNLTSLEVQWCQFLFFCSNQTGATTIVLGPSNSNFSFCSFDSFSSSFDYRSAGTFSNCCFYSPSGNGGLSQSTTACTVTNNIAIRTNGTGFAFAALSASTIDGNVSAGSVTGILINLSASQSLTITNSTTHSNSNIGFSFANATNNTTTLITATGIKSWRNATAGLSASNFTPIRISNSEFFGNLGQAIVLGTAAGVLTLDSCLIAGDTSFSTSNGMVFGGNTTNGIVFVDNCNFSPTSGIYVPVTTADINVSSISRAMVTLSNTFLGAATEVLSPINLYPTGFIKSSKHDQTEGAFKSWFGSGIIERDTTIFNTAAPSERLTPSSASIKLQSGPRLVAVDDLGTVTINVYVRKSVVGDGAAYNGNQPRLILKANPACGINSDVVLDTMTAAAGSWEQLTGTTAAVDADGALEFVIDCDGTVGWVNADDWSVS